ncbi:MAG: hypothetical protein QNK30_01085 [Bacteroidales bacterium]|nr:hypothetical protein [Bacteroidales bacterium]
MKQLRIKTYCHIKNKQVYLNGKLVFHFEEPSSLGDFMKKVYKHFKLKYTRFYKMDDISKLGFVASDLILKNLDGSNFKSEDVGLVLSNSNSTLVTDSHFQESINNYSDFYPSPSVFVYTLPNIMMGEISIRHGFKGENAFYIFERFQPEFIVDYINQLFLSQKLKACIGGWVDQSKDSYEAFIYWADNMEGDSAIKHTPSEIENIYNLT